MNLAKLINAHGMIDLAGVASSGKAYFLPLTRRGFFSEFNVLANAIAFAVMHGHQIFVERGRMLVRWDDIFDTRFPTFDAYSSETYQGWEWMSVKAGRREAFDLMRAEQAVLAESGEVISIPSLEFGGDLETLTAALTRLLFQPSSLVVAAERSLLERGDLSPGEFVALQLRGGDKVLGVLNRKGQLFVEGEVVDAVGQLESLSALASDTLPVLVITDDYRAFEHLAGVFPHRRFVTSCPRDMHGYVHQQYELSDEDERTAQMIRTVADVALASKAAAFTGPFRSNLSICVHHLRDGRASISSDSLKRWRPL